MARKGIVIELTALLDVILILLFAILVQGNFQVEKATEQSEAAGEKAKSYQHRIEGLQEQLEGLEEKNGHLARQLLAKDLIQENSALILLSIEESPGQQNLLVERRDGVIARIALDESVQYIRNSLRNAVEEEIRSTSGLVIFIVFSYDSSVIYQTDYLMVHRFLQEKQDMENVYTVEYDTR